MIPERWRRIAALYHANALLAQPRSRAHHQRGLAHLARGERVTEPALFEILIEFGVGSALDVAGRIAAHCPADNVETG